MVNLIQNPGFEIESTTLTSWIPTPVMPNNIMSISLTTVHSGLRSFKFLIPGTINQTGGRIKQRVSISPNTLYEFSFWGAGHIQGTAQPVMKVTERDSVNNILSTYTATWFERWNTFLQVKKQFTSKSNASFVDIELIFENSFGEFYFDDIIFKSSTSPLPQKYNITTNIIGPGIVQLHNKTTGYIVNIFTPSTIEATEGDIISWWAISNAGAIFNEMNMPGYIVTTQTIYETVITKTGTMTATFEKCPPATLKMTIEPVVI